MVTLWFFGFIVVVLYCAFYAGMNAKSLFYNTKANLEVDDVDQMLNVTVYVFVALAVATAWPIALPVICIYKLGQRFSKEK
jgi:hypothetical protein